MKQAFKEKGKLLTSMLIFGTVGPIRRMIPYPSGLISLVRGTIGTLYLLLLHLIKKEPFAKDAIRKNLPILFFSGLLLGGNWIFLFEAYRHTSLALATTCYYMAPVFFLLLSPIFFHESLTPKKWVCTATALLGLALASNLHKAELSGLSGVLFGLASATMYTGVLILNRFIRKLSDLDRSFFQLAFSVPPVLLYVFLAEDLSTLTVTPSILCLLAIAGIIQTGLAYSLYFGSIGSLPTQTVALYSYIDPVFTIFLSVFVLQEPLTPLIALGILLVIGSTLLCEIDLKHKK